MTASFERIQILLRPDQRAELTRRAREAKTSMAEITRQLLDSGIEKAHEEDKFARTRDFLDKATKHRGKMNVVHHSIAEIINDIRENDHD